MASNSSAIAIGSGTQATAASSIAVGAGSVASGSGSMAFGAGTSISAVNAVRFGASINSFAASNGGIGANAHDKYLFNFSSLITDNDSTGSPGDPLGTGMTSMILFCKDPSGPGTDLLRRVYISSGTPPAGSDVLYTPHVT